MSDITVITQEGNSIDVTVSASTSVTVTTPSDSPITVSSKGPKGDTGETGATGATGATGPGVAAGGTENEFLQKNSATDYDTKWSAYTLPGADGADGQVLTTDGAGTVSFAFPKTIAEDVKNVSGGPLSKGTPVHVTGSVGNLAEVIAADAATNYPAHFVLDEDLADEGEGKGIALGFINNVDVPDASIYTEGQTVYLAAAGGWTTTKPTGTNAIQNLGIIIKVNTSGNKISGIIMGAGRANDVPNIPNGQTWIGNASGVATPTTLATVATTGSYSDLSGTPTIPSGDVVDDTTPQLGGDLDVNGNKITSASNGDITIQPNGTGAIILKSDDIQFDGGGVFGGQIKLHESDIAGSNYIAFKAPLSLATNVTYELPAADGTVGQALTTTATGSVYWSSFLTASNPTINGLLTIEEGATSAATIVMYDLDGSNYIRLDAPDVISSNVTFVLPAADGSPNQVLKTDGSGNLSFVDQSGTVDTTGTPADNQLSVFTDADTIEGDANLTWNGVRLAVVGDLAADSVIVDELSLSSAGDFGAGSRILSRIGTNTLGVTVGDVYYLSGTWAQADADAVSTASGLLGVTVDSETNNGVLASGVVKVADNTGFSSSTEGTVLYLDTTAGHVTATAPSATGDVVRVVGYVLDGTNGIIYFDPSKDWIELS